MKEIGVGLLGCGVVGAGVVDTLRRNADLLARRVGARLVVRGIATKDLSKADGVDLTGLRVVDDGFAVVRDPDVQIVAELIGGSGIALQLVEEALKLGKPVVTANKKLLAEHGAELFGLAERRSVDLHFEASVGGGIPIVRALREGLVANHIGEMCGILNGTCNYILTRMEREGLGFDEVLAAAQAAGYAEAEPSLDIDGWDTAHKAVVLASLAYGFAVPLSAVHVEGIRGLAREDIQFAAALGYRIKLLAIIKQAADAVSVRVHPTLVPAAHMLGSVAGVFNAVLVRGDVVGDTLYYGRGAGRYPTASAVISDLADVARAMVLGNGRCLPPLLSSDHGYRLAAVRDQRSRYYLRAGLLDRPGSIASVAQVLGRHQISIASITQQEERRGEFVPVIILTHMASEAACDAALADIDRLPTVHGKTVRLRIEDFAGGS